MLGLLGASVRQMEGINVTWNGSFLFRTWDLHFPNCPYLKGFQNHNDLMDGCPKVWKRNEYSWR